jgi:phytoene dehydrogenase-like protein
MSSPLTVFEAPRHTPVLLDADVVVCGGGPAGVGAALAAARTGARTVLLESQLCLGGMATAGMLNRLGPYHDQEKLILGGLPLEILRALIARELAQEPVPCPPKEWKQYWLVFDPEGMKVLLDELMAAAGVTVLLGASVAAPILEGDRLTGVLIESKSGRHAVLGKVVIDTTGDGDLAARAGVPFVIGREEDGLTQPVTLMSKVLNEDWPTAFAYVSQHYGELLQRAEAEVGNDFVWAGTDNYLHPEETYYNCVHVHEIDGTDVGHLSRAAVEMRRKIWRNLELLRRHVPGCAAISLITSAAQMGVRESRRIQGDYTLTIDDVLDGRQFPDQIARYACFVDIHKIAPGRTDSAYVDRSLAPGQSYGIPYRSLLPQGVEGLLVAGRCFSATHEALASARMMPACMAMGQAAGTAAALAVDAGVPPRQVAIATLQARLAADGVVL